MSQFKKYISMMLIVMGVLYIIPVQQTFAATLTDFSHEANTWAPEETATHTFHFTTVSNIGSWGYLRIETSGLDFSAVNTGDVSITVNNVSHDPSSVSVSNEGQLLYIGFFEINVLAGNIITVSIADIENGVAGEY